PLPRSVCVVGVPDTKRALGALAGGYRRQFQLPVVAVTGSNGKTSTKDMIAAILSQKLAVLSTEGNFNNEIGLPLTLLGINADHGAAVVEMGMRARGEIAYLAEIAAPTMGLV